MQINWKQQKGAHLATRVWAAGPVDANLLGEIQLLLQLLHNRHCPVLGLDHRQATELRACITRTCRLCHVMSSSPCKTVDKRMHTCAPVQDTRPRVRFAGVDEILLEDGLLLHLLHALVGDPGKDDVLLHSEPHRAITIPACMPAQHISV